MKNTFGSSVLLTVFGESHGNAVGVVLDGMAPGIEIDEEFIASRLSLRRPAGKISTPRVEKDEYIIESGVFEGHTTGTPICIIIPNENVRSKDYGKIYGKARPGHADYTAFCKYHGFEDYRGGGHFSGRITAGVVAAGAIAALALSKKGIEIGTHIKSCAGISDREFGDLNSDIEELKYKQFAVLDDMKAAKILEEIEAAAADKDSVGGVLETAVTGLPAGIGEPWFDSVESIISHAMFGVPAVKGIEFGDGFELAGMRGSSANDEFIINEGSIKTLTNSNGGINGGITNGMPLVFRCAVKPTPSISKAQRTIDFRNNEEISMEVTGRHAPCIVHRARIVVDSVTAIVLCDLLAMHFGTDWLGE